MIADEMIHGRLPRFRPARSARPPHERPALLPLPEQRGLGEWDATARLWKEIQMRRHKAGKTDGPPWRRPTQIEDDTPIVPRAVAESVCEEASLWFGEPFPRQWEAELEERANLVYQLNARFHRLMRRRGNIGRDALRAFTRHWLCALLANRRPDLFCRLPRGYASGHDLPEPPPRPDPPASPVTGATT
ncbi:MAG: hypothetical protein ABSH34_02045 [Verrucomicrobiota bacterium]